MAKTTKDTTGKKVARIGMRPKEGTPGPARKRVKVMTGTGKTVMQDRT